MVVTEAGGDLRLTHRELPQPGHGEVLVRVSACGICHSDVWAKDGGHGGTSWPLVPGHEIAGEIQAVGGGVEGWAEGQRVGVGWFGGSCGHCRSCLAGVPISCSTLAVPGITFDGGYADHVVVKAAALAAIPDALDAAEAAPLMCAGVTTFNGLRRSTAKPGDRVAVLGLGGLGHLGVQFATRMGFETVAIARGPEKAEAAAALGAHHYIDSTTTEPGSALAALGGVSVLLATAPSADAVQACIEGVAPRGEVVLVGAPAKPIRVFAGALISKAISVRGHASGTPRDSEDAMAFSALWGIRPTVEVRPLEDAAGAYEQMVTGKARFRMVLTTGAERGTA